MSRRCELKLIDVLKEGNLDMAKSKFNSVSGTKSDTPIESRSSRTRFGNTSTLKKKYDSGTLKQQTEITSKKRKKLNDVSELPSKKIFTGSNIIKNPVKPDKEISQKKKRKTKSRESCWENKLTGARRVSKRLSNLRISLKKLESSLATSFVTIKTRQPVAFSARGKMKQNYCDLKPPKKNKTSQYRNFPETQFNFGKLGHPKRLHPKITTARRPETYTVTVKSTASASHSRRNDKKQGNITHNTFDEDSNDSDVNLLIERCVEDIQNDLSEPESYTEEDKKISKAYQLLKSKETIEENEEKAAQDTKVETLICEQVDELTDDSTILIGVNVE
ncbi:uncharacterized protein LOC128990135 [Macrosteles quadrilineatus]|uniref:uncharacterized protein LOC128990135 n=1 Tax=Macrosteles quadrilineatus TaxID=74068 RepID=UPI0023E17022|nr:uncharacterized protein LOC128990135 [Macrosteles quadrilineatus]